MMTGPSPSLTPMRIDPPIRKPGSVAPAVFHTRALASAARPTTAPQVQIIPECRVETIRGRHPTRCPNHAANDAVTLSP